MALTNDHLSTFKRPYGIFKMHIHLNAYPLAAKVSLKYFYIIIFVSIPVERRRFL